MKMIFTQLVLFLVPCNFHFGLCLIFNEENKRVALKKVILTWWELSNADTWFLFRVPVV